MFGVFKVILDGAQATDGIHQITMPEKEIPARRREWQKRGGNDFSKNAIIRAYAKEFSKFSVDGPGNVRPLS